MMGANMKCDKRSLALLSNKRTKAYTRTKADEAFALPSFSDAMSTVPILAMAETTTEHVYTFPDDATPGPFFSVERSKASAFSTPVHYCDRPDHGMEQLKQTMIHQESLFKEQLGELHRLYQVQKSLMSEWNRKGDAAVHPHPDPPFVNNSLLHSVDVSKEKNNLHEPNNHHASEVDINRTPLFFPTRVDMNKPFEDVDRIEGQKGKTVRRPLFDLEQPAELYVDEIEDGKSTSLLRETTAETESKGFVIFQQRLDAVNVERDSNRKWGNGQSDCPSESMNSIPPAVVSVRTTNSFSMGGSPLFSVQASSSTVFHSGGNKLGCTSDSLLCPRKQEPTTLQDGQKRCWLSVEKNYGISTKLPHWLLQASSEARNSHRSHSTSFTSSGQQQSFSPQEHTEANQFGSHKLSNYLFSGGAMSSLTAENHSLQLFSSEMNIQGLPPKEPPNNFSGFFSSRGDQEMQRTGNTVAVNASFLSFFAARSVEEMQRALPNALTANVPSYIHTVDDHARGLRQTCLAGQMLVDGHTSSTSGTHDARSMFLNSGESSNLSRIPPWLQSKLQQSPYVQQSFKPTNSMQRVSHLDVPEPQNNNQFQDVMPLNNNNGSQHHSATEVVLTPWSDVDAKKNAPSATSTVEQHRLDHTLQMKNTQDVREYVETWSFRNGQRNGKTDGLNASKVGFDLNVMSDEVSGEDVVEAAPKESKGLYAKLGIKMSGHKGQKTLQSSLIFEGNGSFDHSAEELHTGVTSAVQQVVDDCSCYSKGAIGNADCGNDAGGHYEGVKSSDGSGLTSESQEAVPLASIKAIEDSNASSGDPSGDSVQNMVMAFSSNMLSNERIGMLCEEACKSIRSQESPSFPTTSTPLLHDLNEEYVVMDDRDIRDVALEAADVLFRLGSDASVMVPENSYASKYQEMSLNWLADLVSKEENYGVTGMDVDSMATEMPAGCSEPSFVDGPETALDSFELAVLRMKPILIEDIKLEEPPVKICEAVEESNPVPNPRRRSSRRGKANKDFQRDVLPNMACLSRHEVSEDLQIIEGLIKSAMETREKCDCHKEGGSVMVKLETGSAAKHTGKGSGKGTKSCKGGAKQKAKASLKVCSWGESTRRRRMRRQRSQWLCLPPAVL